MSLEDMTVDELRAHAAQLESRASLLAQLSTNPETRETLQRAMKKINPKLVIPEIDATDKVLSKVNELAEDNKKLRQEILEKDIRERLEKDRSGVQAKFKLSDEDMKGVEALMVDKDHPIPSYEAAAKVFKAERTSATPTPALYNPPTYTMPDKETWGKGIGNKSMLDKIAINEAYAAWNELQSGKVPGLGAARS